MTFDTTKSDVSTVKKHMCKGSLKVDPWLVAVLACFTLFAWAYWGKMEYPIIDTGREVEISARIVDGQILYRDLATYYGPLAYYANATALLLFGHHLSVLYVVALGLGLAATLLFYRLALRLMNARWAALCTVCMLIYCAFGLDLFNFMLPYSYGGVYATVLCLLAITFLDYYAYKGQLGWLFAAAIACGLAGLAKQEYGVAALGAVLVGANLYSPQSLKTRVVRSLLTLVVAGVCVFIPLALLAQASSWENLYLSLLPLSQLDVAKRNIIFQLSPAKTLLGWWFTFRAFFTGSLVVLVSVVAVRSLSKFRWIKANSRVRSIVEVLAGFALAWVCFKLLNSTISVNLFHPLHNLSWCLPVLIGWFCFTRPQLPQYKHAPLMWTLLVFSLLLNARWLFLINFYGLYATPVVLLFFTMFYHLTRRNHAIVWRYLLVCLLIGGSMNLRGTAQYRYTVNSAYGTFYTRDAALALAFNKTILAIKASGASSVLVLPEGNLLNFLTATHSPSRELTFLPLVLPTAKDEQEFIAQMEANPPELIAYVYRPFLEWGYKSYAEFNPLVDSWIIKQHKLIQVFPMHEGGIRLYSRN